MRKSTVLGAMALAACLVAVPVLAGEMASQKSHDLTVVFVSFDAKAKTVTFKDDQGASKTVPVMDTAMRAFEGIKAGDKVTLTCADNEKGEHQGVAMAKPAQPEKKA
jgi:hypothetical protein